MAIGELTVAETLDFAARAQGTGLKAGTCHCSRHVQVDRLIVGSKSALTALVVVCRLPEADVGAGEGAGSQA